MLAIRSNSKQSLARSGSKSARLLRLAWVTLLLGSIASTTPAGASGPKPDPAPAKSSPQPAYTHTPAATHTYTPPAATTSPAKTATTKSHKRTSVHKKLKKKHAKKAKLVVTKPKPALMVTEPKPTPATVNPTPARTGAASSGLRSKISAVLGVVVVALVGVGVFLLLLASLDPYYLRPWRLRTAIENHRGDVAIGGLLLLGSIGIVYLISRSAGA